MCDAYASVVNISKLGNRIVENIRNSKGSLLLRMTYSWAPQYDADNTEILIS